MQSITHSIHGNPDRWERPALAAGIVFAAIQLAAVAFFTMVLIPRMPPLDASVVQHAQFYARHGSLLGVTNYLLTLPAPFFVLFLGGLFGVLRRAEGFVGTLTVAAVLAGAAMVMIWPFGILLTNIGPSIVAHGGDYATAWAFDGMAPLSLALSAFPRAVLLGATSLVLLDSRLIPRWIGWLGLVLAPISLIGTATLVIGELFPFLAIGTLIFAIWVLALSGSLLRSTQAASKTIAHMAGPERLVSRVEA